MHTCACSGRTHREGEIRDPGVHAYVCMREVYGYLPGSSNFDHGTCNHHHYEVSSLSFKNIMISEIQRSCLLTKLLCMLNEA